MNSRAFIKTFIPRVILGILLWSFAGCFPGGRGGTDGDPSLEASFNLFELASLEKTVSIELFVEGEPRKTITEPDAVAEMSRALDVNAELTPLIDCPDYYTLVFRLEDGSEQVFGVACEPDGHRVIHGEQEFWRGQAMIAPAMFRQVLQRQLQKCATKVYGDEVPEGTLMAFDTALTFLRWEMGDDGPPADLIWNANCLNPSDLPCDAIFQFTAWEWTGEVRCPAGSEDGNTYRVQIHREGDEFEWEGFVSPEGEVVESAP